MLTIVLTLTGDTDFALPIVTFISETCIFAGVQGHVFGDIPLCDVSSLYFLPFGFYLISAVFGSL